MAQRSHLAVYFNALNYEVDLRGCVTRFDLLENGIIDGAYLGHTP
jgi:hypothetical protein